MERHEVSLGIDLGTSGIKVALVDAQGTALAVAARPFAVRSPRPGWAETPPAQWAAAARAAVAEVLSQCPDVRVVALGIDGQMHGVVLVRGASPVRDAILWPDSRASAELALWRAVPETVRATLANPLTAGMAGPVLAWLTRHEPEAIAAADTMVAPKDWLRMQLVPGEPVTDPSDASATPTGPAHWSTGYPLGSLSLWDVHRAWTCAYAIDSRRKPCLTRSHDS